MIQESEFLTKLNNFLRNFDFNKINGEGSKTQKRAEITEEYVRSFIIDLLKDETDNYLVVQAGTQQPYDFIVINRTKISNWPGDFGDKLLAKYDKDQKIHNLIKKEFEKLDPQIKDEILRIEVKAGKGTYYGNDTLPDPQSPVIYFFFDWKINKLLFVNSVEMAKKTGDEKYNYVLKKFLEDKIEVDKWRNEKTKQWKEMGISSTPRMTYKFNSEYAYTDQTEEEFLKTYQIFLKALW